MNTPTSSIRRSDDAQANERLWQLIKGVHFGMFTSRQNDGHLHSRPMTTQNKAMDEDRSLWFFMSRGSDPVSAIDLDAVVNVTYADAAADRYVSVSGLALVVDDLAKKRELWSKLAEAWFPGGAADPDLALVQVRISQAAFWDVKESKLVQLHKTAKVAATGKPPTGRGEHAELLMH